MTEYIVEFGEHPSIEDKGALREKIVRCRDCKHYNAYQDLCERLKPGMVVMEPNFGFCAWAERKVDE